MPTAEEITRHTDDDPDGIEWVGVDPPPRPIEIVASDPSWPAQFAELAARIREALGDRALAVEHVGSTSVPGLAAKPIIDIDVTVADPRDESSYVPRPRGGRVHPSAPRARLARAPTARGAMIHAPTCTSSGRTARSSSATACCATG